MEAGANIEFSCSFKQGAALILKYPARRCDSDCEGILGKHMLRHYRDWHAFAQEKRNPEMPLSDIILVTGCDLTREWATVVFTEKASNASINFTAGVPSYPSVGASFWGSWSTETSVPHRCGPVPPMVMDELSGLLTAPSTTIQESGPYNQCVFIRGYRVQERLMFPKKLKAAAGPSDVQGQRDPEPEVPHLV